MSGANPVTNGEKKDTRIKPGEVRNPHGRPKGSRHKLGEDFLKALQADFAQHGKRVIEDVREEKPDVYLKVIASVLPKEIEVSGEVALTTKEQRDAALSAFQRTLAEEVMQ
ncbi:MAG: hypothetical protein J7498_05460 [Sphingobium sp.]|nr:hypothetical protein [Sphingobium sp.]